MSGNEVVTDTIVVKINGQALSAEQMRNLQSVTVEQTWSAADRIELRFTERDDIALDPDIGADVSAAISIDGAAHPVFTGQITAIGYRWAYGEDTLVLEGYDARHRLTRAITPETLEDSKLSDVVSRIASRHGLQSQVPADLTKSTYPSWITAGSDFAILQQISLLTGCPWSLVDKKIVFTDPTSSGTDVTLDAGSLIDLDLRSTPIERSAKVEVHGWDPVKKQDIVGTASRPSPALAPATGLKAGTSLDEKVATSWRHGPRDRDEANRIATAIGRRLDAAEIIGRGVTTAQPRIKPGAVVKIESVSKRANGTYRVSEARHVYGAEAGSLRTHFRIGSADAGFADLLAPDARTSNALTHGVTVGIVTATDHTKGRQAQPGQVRVKLPFLGDNIQTGWARLMSHGSGTDRGSVFVPEVGDEVLVAFEHGDLNRPYVLGTVWNESGSAFADVLDGNAVQERRIVSRLGNRLRFIDAGSGDDKSGISIEADAAKTRFFLGYKTTTIETKDRPLQIVNGKASIVLDKDEVTIKANKITISSPSGDVAIDGQNVKVTGKMNVDVTANSTVTVKGNATVNVESSGMTNVKGSMVKVN